MKTNSNEGNDKIQLLKRYYHDSTLTTNNNRNKKPRTTSIYYNNPHLINSTRNNHANLTNLTSTPSSSSSASSSVQIIASSSFEKIKPFIMPSYLTQSNHLISQNRSQTNNSQYFKKPTMFGVHDKTIAVKRKLERLKILATSWNSPNLLQNISFQSNFDSNSSLVDLNPLKNTLIERLAKKIPVNEFRNRIKDINKADNEARLRYAQKRNQKLPSFSETILRTSDATLDTPRPPEPCLPTYQEIRDRQKLLDQTFGKRKIRRRKLRKSLDLDKLTLVQKTLSKKSGVISELAAGGYVQAHDIQKLRPRQWINDEIVTFYTILINQRSLEFDNAKSNSQNNSNGYDETETFLKTHCFNSFFMPKYDQNGYEGVRRWSKKVDLLSKDIIIFPINIGNAHWTCAAINLRAKRFEYFDSMGHKNPSVLANLREYITNEALAKKNIILNVSDWPDFYYSNLPQQNNSFDCGIFVCQFMDCLSRDWSFNSVSANKNDQFNTTFDFDQSNMEYIRTKMVYEIVTKKFLKEEWD